MSVKRWAGHVVVNAEAERDAFDETRFARAEFAGEGRRYRPVSAPRRNRWPKAMVSARFAFQSLCEVIITLRVQRTAVQQHDVAFEWPCRFQSAATGMAIAASACRQSRELT